jgi:tetratricopeptide (TPR) repeat protein
MMMTMMHICCKKNPFNNLLICRLSLIKVSVLMALTKSDEAIEVLKRMIAAHFRQTGDLRLDGGTTVVSEGTFGPGSFLAKFLGDHGSIYEFETSMLTDQNKLTSFNELTEAFPASVDNYTATKANDGYPIPNEILTPQDLKELSLYRVLKGLGQSPSNVLASLLWLEVAQVYLKESLYADAEAAASQAFKANEVFAPIFAVFGQIDEAQARWTSAIAFYRRGLAIDRDDLGCLLGLSRCLLVASASADSDAAAKLFEAEGMARRAIEIDATIAEAWSLLGQSCLRSGRHEGAGQHFRAAMTLDSVSPLRSYRILPILSE